MRYYLLTAVLPVLLLANCTPAPQIVSLEKQTHSWSSSSSSDRSSTAGTQTSEGLYEVQDKDLPSHMLRENDHNFFVILSTSKDKDAANETARYPGAWVLPTDLTSGLTPRLYAVVYGPFKSLENANAKLEYDLREHANAYVKDAGKLKVPTTLKRFAQKLPTSVLVAFSGRLDDGIQENIEFNIEKVEFGGTLCRRTPSAYLFTALLDGKIVEDSMSSEEIKIYKRWLQGIGPSEYNPRWRVNFDVIEESGEVVSTELCFD